MRNNLPRPRGRPRDPAKRQALLQAARALFLQHGVDGVTVDKVVAGAGVSRATYYSNFTDRNALLAAVIAAESEQIVPDGNDFCQTVDVREALARYGDHFVAFLAHPDTSKLEPLIAHVGQTSPELGVELFMAGPRHVWDVLADIVRHGQACGEIERNVDPEQSVSDLIGLWRGSWYVSVIYGQRAMPDEVEQRRISRHGVDVFLRAFGSPASQSNRN